MSGRGREELRLTSFPRRGALGCPQTSIPRERTCTEAPPSPWIRGPSPHSRSCSARGQGKWGGAALVHMHACAGESAAQTWWGGRVDRGRATSDKLSRSTSHSGGRRLDRARPAGELRPCVWRAQNSTLLAVTGRSCRALAACLPPASCCLLVTWFSLF